MVYSNCCCSFSFEPEIVSIGQLSHKMYSNNILNFQVSTTILNAHTKNVSKLIVCISYLEILRIKFILRNSYWLQSRVPNDLGISLKLSNGHPVKINKYCCYPYFQFFFGITGSFVSISVNCALYMIIKEIAIWKSGLQDVRD